MASPAVVGRAPGGCGHPARRQGQGNAIVQLQDVSGAAAVVHCRAGASPRAVVLPPGGVSG